MVAALQQHGIRVRGVLGDQTVAVGATTDPAQLGTVDMALVLVDEMTPALFAVSGPAGMVCTMVRLTDSPAVGPLPPPLTRDVVVTGLPLDVGDGRRVAAGVVVIALSLRLLRFR